MNGEIDSKDIEEVISDYPELPEETKDEFNGELEIYLSTDGKNTVHLKTSEPDKSKRQKMIAKAMELYDFVLARYGTKQAQAVKEYGKENGHVEVKPEDCKHVNIKFAQSKTEKNPGRWFKSCIDCKSFLGWTS